MSMSHYFANQILDRYLSGAIFLSLHSGAPGDSGAHQVGERVACGDHFGKSIGGIKIIERTIEFEDMPSAEVTHAGLWDARDGGNFLIGGAIAEKKRTTKGDTLRFKVGKLAFALE